jgi:hypothetical protein
MKVVFIGPSFPDIHIPQTARVFTDQNPNTVICGPARQGDVARSVLRGATAIGLVDGRFEDVPSVWHKEILFALSHGIHVCGAASLGALRAAECARFGMVGIGQIFRRYACRDLIDDDAVAQLYAAGELGYIPLSEPLVNIEATLGHLHELGHLSGSETCYLMQIARRLFFKDRTYDRIMDEAAEFSAARRDVLSTLLRSRQQNPKRDDAILLLNHLLSLPDARGTQLLKWTFSNTKYWSSFVQKPETQPHRD